MILDKVNEAWPGKAKHLPVVVITGGEPFRQNISPLVSQLIIANYLVQIETNGTYGPPQGFPIAALIVCSPKAPRVAQELLHRITAYKYVLEHTAISDKDGLPTSILGRDISPARPHVMFSRGIYVSPMDTGDEVTNKLNIDATVRSCMAFGYILNLQIHKLVNLP